MRKPIKFLDLLKQINNDELDTGNLEIEYLDTVYTYNQDDGFFVNKDDPEDLLSDKYTDSDLINMGVILINDADYRIEPWKKELIYDYITKYIQLEIELNSCQGCTSGAGNMMKQMKYYQEKIKELDGDFDYFHKMYYDKIWNKEVEKQKEKELEEERKDKIIKLLQLDWFNLSQIEDSITSKIFVQIEDKINEICRILRGEKIDE